MKVLLLNGSPRENGCTNAALRLVGGSLNENGIETQLFWVGKDPVSGCTECNACKAKPGRCGAASDAVNEFLSAAEGCDGFIFGSPVFFGSPNGSVISLLDRAFFSSRSVFYGKAASAVVTTRRSGGSSALEVLNKYIKASCMPLVSAHHWPIIHANTPEEVTTDLEGVQTMQVLGRNMAWLLKCIEAGRKLGIEFPALLEPAAHTNFIR